jgi:hypothetical protein
MFRLEICQPYCIVRPGIDFNRTTYIQHEADRFAYLCATCRLSVIRGKRLQEGQTPPFKLAAIPDLILVPRYIAQRHLSPSLLTIDKWLIIMQS